MSPDSTGYSNGLLQHSERRIKRRPACYPEQGGQSDPIAIKRRGFNRKGIEMNKTLSILPAAILLGGCAVGGNTFGSLDGGTGMGGSIVKMAVESQCRAELDRRSEWRLTALAMSAEKQAEWENKICGCVAQEAPERMTGSDVMQMLDPSTRNQALAALTAKTVSACFGRLYR